MFIVITIFQVRPHRTKGVWSGRPVYESSAEQPFPYPVFFHVGHSPTIIHIPCIYLNDFPPVFCPKLSIILFFLLFIVISPELPFSVVVPRLLVQRSSSISPRVSRKAHVRTCMHAHTHICTTVKR